MQGGTTYAFVTDGIEAALELARAAAGDKNVGIWGGANIMRQYLKAGLLDEMQIHLIPMLLGGGIRLFEDLDPEGIELRRTSSIETPSATHFRFEIGEVTHVILKGTRSSVFHGKQEGWPERFGNTAGPQGAGLRARDAVNAERAGKRDLARAGGGDVRIRDRRSRIRDSDTLDKFDIMYFTKDRLVRRDST
jgi:hypothetical protein